jgi:hypothetical protein
MGKRQIASSSCRAEPIIEVGEYVTRGLSVGSAGIGAFHYCPPWGYPVHTGAARTSQNAKRKSQRSRPEQPAIWPLTALLFIKNHTIRGPKTTITILFSTANGDFSITCLFSITHWEQFFCPFVFNKSLGGTFIFNISLLDLPIRKIEKEGGYDKIPNNDNGRRPLGGAVETRGTFSLRRVGVRVPDLRCDMGPPKFNPPSTLYHMSTNVKINKPWLEPSIRKSPWRGRPARCPRERPAPAPPRGMAILAMTPQGQDARQR